ncbi:hypothetical protein [Shinella sp. JR1-6]|uniref:hypothetical protein n=1 Tax=Shinella sp. JR1-6 TaxID=2527671 RepID=UPI001FE19A08|nr:hypothetical protein [Shinella sp. JR1-6]
MSTIRLEQITGSDADLKMALTDARLPPTTLRMAAAPSLRRCQRMAGSLASPALSAAMVITSSVRSSCIRIGAEPA